MGRGIEKEAPRHSRTSIPCGVFPSMFSSERAIVVKDADGEEWVGFADNKSIITKKDVVVNSEGVDGRVVVEVDKIEGDKAIVVLPQQRLVAGERMAVSADDLQTEPAT